MGMQEVHTGGDEKLIIYWPNGEGGENRMGLGMWQISYQQPLHCTIAEPLHP